MNCSVIIVRNADSVAEIANLKEPIYGTKYKIVKISEELIEVGRLFDLYSFVKHISSCKNISLIKEMENCRADSRISNSTSECIHTEEL